MSCRVEEVATETWALTDSDQGGVATRVVFDKLTHGLVLTRRIPVVSTAGNLQQQLSGNPSPDRHETIRISAAEAVQLRDLLVKLLPDGGAL